MGVRVIHAQEKGGLALKKLPCDFRVAAEVFAAKVRRTDFVHVERKRRSGIYVQLANDSRPVWSPDGTQLAFFTDRDGNAEIYVMDADGSDPTRLTDHVEFDGFPAWSPAER